MASVVYFAKVMEILSESREMRKTVIGIAKQTGYAAGGAIVGGLVGGPPGAFVGTVFGRFTLHFRFRM